MTLICPVCGEEAVSRPPNDLTPQQKGDGLRPAYSHRDGTQLCPAMGRRGYEPAQPVRL